MGWELNIYNLSENQSLWLITPAQQENVSTSLTPRWILSRVRQLRFAQKAFRCQELVSITCTTSWAQSNNGLTLHTNSIS